MPTGDYPVQEVVNVPGTAPSLAQAVKAEVRAKVPDRYAKMKVNTRELTTGYAHILIYGDTDARKTSTAAAFGGPEKTRIVLVRRKEQLIPLRNQGFDAFCAEDLESANYALENPEAIWPEWADLPDRTLVLDDATKYKEMSITDKETAMRWDPKTRREVEVEVRDPRKTVPAARKEIGGIIDGILRKPMNFIAIALANVYEDKLTHEKMITPDLSSSIARMLNTDFEFVFYVDKKTWTFITGHIVDKYTGKDENGRDAQMEQIIFAKNKLPLELVGKGAIFPRERMDLRAIWDKVLNASKK